MLNLSKFKRNDSIFNQVGEKTKLTKWVNIDPKSPFCNSEELLAIFDDDTLIGYIHVEDVTTEWNKFKPKRFGITKFLIFPEFQKKGHGKEAALALFNKQKSEGYTNIIMQVESNVLLFWLEVLSSQKLFLKENIELIEI